MKKIVIAHRGASAYMPEHTLGAKIIAHTQGANFIEQDVILTKDNIPIVLHDITIDNVTNVKDVFPKRVRNDGRYYGIDFTLEEIKSLKIVERFDLKTKQLIYPNRYQNTLIDFKISTLEEELNLIQTLNKTTNKDIGIYTEIKAPSFHIKNGKDISPIVLDILKKFGYKNKNHNFYLQTFDFNELKRIRTQLGFKGKFTLLLKDGSLHSDYLKSDGGLKEIAIYADAIGSSINDIIIKKHKISNLVQLAQQHNLKVHSYTARKDDLNPFVSSFDDTMEILFNKANVDGIFTDFPDLSIRFLNNQTPLYKT